MASILLRRKEKDLMRHVFLLALFYFVAAPQTARAQDPKPVIAAPDRVQVIEDDEAGKLRIVIDGKEVGWFDADGLRLSGTVKTNDVDVGAAAASEESAR